MEKSQRKTKIGQIPIHKSNNKKIKYRTLSRVEEED
jgi:hypothetical protein